MKVNIPVEKECTATWLAYGPSFKKRILLGSLVFQESIAAPEKPIRAAEQSEDVFKMLPELKPQFEVPPPPNATVTSYLFTILGCLPLLLLVVIISKQGASPLKIWMTLIRETPHYIPIMLMAVCWVVFCAVNWLVFEIQSTLQYGSVLSMMTLIVCTWSFRRDHLK